MRVLGYDHNYSSNRELAREHGFYKLEFYCESCNLYIGKEIHNKHRIMSRNTLLKNNEFPTYCPNCGEKING